MRLGVGARAAPLGPLPQWRLGQARGRRHFGSPCRAGFCPSPRPDAVGPRRRARPPVRQHGSGTVHLQVSFNGLCDAGHYQAKQRLPPGSQHPSRCPLDSERA
eukprot:2971650-Pyramimonas_sp.AAC.1